MAGEMINYQRQTSVFFFLFFFFLCVFFVFFLLLFFYFLSSIRLTRSVMFKGIIAINENGAIKF